MMDILEQLKKPRETVNGLPVGECYGCYDVQRADAAAEIERLRAALQSIADTDGNHLGWAMRCQAKEALARLHQQTRGKE